MDINSLIPTQLLLGSSKPLENTLNLKVGQQLDVKVTPADIDAAKNAITLSLGNNKTVTVQSNQPITLSPGQDLKIQVTQVAPVVEFKILNPLPEQKTLALAVRLRLISTTDLTNSATIRPAPTDTASAATGKELPQATTKAAVAIAIGNNPPDNEAVASLEKQPLTAKIIGLIGNKIQLQVFESGNKPAATLNIERSQLTNAPADLKVGQQLSLELVKPGTAPEFKIVPSSSNIPEAKVAEFIKQFLPKHEAAPIFLNQLIKDLPQLMKNPSVPEALKDIAAKIVQNLPPKEQLVTSQGLKQAIADSGLFLEAKLPPAIAQAELIKELPQLIKNASVPQSLQRIATELLQNLTQKDPLLNTPPVKPSVASPLLANVGETAKTSADSITELITGDFKANLLKFIQALKQEITLHSDQQTSQTDLDLLKNLQHKTENTVAKLVLDQLMSLPKDDNPKQLWIIDIPFMDRQRAESVRIEVQRDKENQRPADNGDWSVNITITPPELGTIHCAVSFRHDLINTFFKSQNSQTTELIKHNLDYLKNQLEQSGLKTGHMDAHDGAQKTLPPHPQLAGKKLFDDKA